MKYIGADPDGKTRETAIKSAVVSADALLDNTALASWSIRDFTDMTYGARMRPQFLMR